MPLHAHQRFPFMYCYIIFFPGANAIHGFGRAVKKSFIKICWFVYWFKYFYLKNFFFILVCSIYYGMCQIF